MKQESGQLGRYNEGLWAVLPRFDSRQGKNFLHRFQTSSRAQPVSYLMGTAAFPQE
jgi:hypothetical protein